MKANEMPERIYLFDYNDAMVTPLEGEEPVSEDLKVELNEYIKDHFTIDKEQLDRFGIDEKDYMYSMDRNDMLALVEHFTNWQKTKEGSVSEDLEEACEQLAENARKHKAETSSPFFSQTDYKQGVMDGVQWQKKQLITKAVETTFNVSLPSGLYDKLWIKGCKDWDKLLVIKKDEL